MKTISISIVLPILLLLQTLLIAPASVAEDGKKLFITEAYYQVKWGHFDEFLELFKRNHYPILAELKKRGVIESMEATFPLYHGSEDSRWDLRVTIALRDTAEMAKAFPKVSKELYPDQKKLAEEERHRFTLLKGHSDIVIRVDDMSSW